MSRKWKKTKSLPSLIKASGLKNLPGRLDICGASEGFQLLAAEGEGERRLRKFAITAYTGVSMSLGGFSSPVVVDISGIKVQAQKKPILFNHDTERIVGHSEEIGVTDQRLKLSGVISGVGDDTEKVLAMADNGFPWQASIGSSVDQIEFVERGQSVKVNGRNFNGPLYVARKTTLREVSFVPIGADSATSAKIAAHSKSQNIEKETAMSFDQWLEANEFDAESLTEKQKSKLEAQWQAESKPKPKADPPETEKKTDKTMADIVAAAREDENRCNAIRDIISAALLKRDITVEQAEVIGHTAIEGKWTEQRTELEILRIKRTPGPVSVISRHQEVNGKVIEAAVCMTGGLEKIDKQFDEETLDAAHKRYPRGVGLGELVSIFARRNGWDGLTIKSDLRGALRAAFSDDDRGIKANVGPSTYDLSGLFTNVANKFLRTSFEAVDPSWREIADIGSVRDFKEVTGYALTGDLIYQQLPPGGEIKHGTLDLEEYGNQAKTQALMIGIDRQHLINDDLGALTGVSKRLGRGAALSLNLLFWTEFLDNLSFFTSGRGNFDDGADSAFDADGLESANLLFLNQTDPDGQPLAVTPRILLVPSSLLIAARRLINSETLLTASDVGATNPWSNSFRIVSSPYLSNTAITGNSTKKWYLLADPSDVPVIQVVFLNGVQTPVVETSELDFDRLGIAIRAYHDVGVRKQEYRAGVAMKGEV